MASKSNIEFDSDNFDINSTKKVDERKELVMNIFAETISIRKCN
jgi:hypothetical protein